MTAIALLAAAAILSLAAIIVLLQRSHREAQAQWAVERRELLNRIQRPNHIPVEPVPGFEMPEREPDEWATVGQIEINDKWMNGED